MAHVESYHSARGGYDFLGLREGRAGGMEIVYDDGVARRLVWRVETADAQHSCLGEALSVAVNKIRVVPALYDELKKRSISIEAISQ